MMPREKLKFLYIISVCYKRPDFPDDINESFQVVYYEPPWIISGPQGETIRYRGRCQGGGLPQRWGLHSAPGFGEVGNPD